MKCLNCEKPIPEGYDVCTNTCKFEYLKKERLLKESLGLKKEPLGLKKEPDEVSTYFQKKRKEYYEKNKKIIRARYIKKRQENLEKFRKKEREYMAKYRLRKKMEKLSKDPSSAVTQAHKPLS